jgi:isopentenyl-diphosphate Delta-isomerase
MEQEIILVDSDDIQIGIMEKLKAHQLGLLHRAFSIFIFNSEGEILLQKRASDKYHSGGLWSNACCSHPVPNISIYQKAQERLQEEMGFDCELDFLYKFEYRINFPNGLIEHELDHIFVGKSDDTPSPNPDEVSEYCWINFQDLATLIIQDPERYTFWLRKILENHSLYHWHVQHFSIVTV